jgi:hypothetical protein
MLTFIPTELVTLAACESAFVDVCVESAPPSSTTQSGSMIRGGAAVAGYPTRIDTAVFLVQPTLSASGRVNSIPIHPPRCG